MNTTEIATDWNALLREALALETQGQYLASILIYEKLLEQFPGHPVLHKNYGHVLYKAGHLSQCLTAYDKSLALADHQPELYVTKGAILNSFDQLTDAIACYEKAIQLKSVYPEAYFYGSSRFRGVTTTYSVRHSQISTYLRHQARYAEITDLSHISHNNAA